jgi:hypothetical protein
VNRDGFITVFKRIWRTEGEVGFKEIQPNVWIFEFSKETDKIRVLKGRPWSFDWSLLALSEFDGGIPSSHWNFTSSPFWIQIHDMPLICMTKAIGGKSRWVSFKYENLLVFCFYYGRIVHEEEGCPKRT